MIKVVFQGDSITDAGRYREDDRRMYNDMGSGYAQIVSGILGNEYPGKFDFINRGISGNRTVDLYGRMKRDGWLLKPDVLSILIGVNDVFHDLADNNGFEKELSEELYDLILMHTKEKLPDVKLILMEPFVLYRPKAETGSEEYVYERVRESVQITRRMAEKYDATLVPLFNEFIEAEKKMPQCYYSFDGIHPNYNGAGLIANEWIKAFKKNIIKNIAER